MKAKNCNGKLYFRILQDASSVSQTRNKCNSLLHQQYVIISVWCVWLVWLVAWPLCQGAEWRTNWIVASETNRKRCDHHPRKIPSMRPRHSSVGLEVTTPKLLMCINHVGISWLISYAESTSWEKDVLFPEKPPHTLDVKIWDGSKPVFISYHIRVDEPPFSSYSRITQATRALTHSHRLSHGAYAARSPDSCATDWGQNQ